MKHLRICFVSLVFLFVFLCAGNSSAQKLLSPDLLRNGDIIGITLKTPAEDAASINSSYSISAAGTIRLPKLKAEITVSGLSRADAARKIEAAYRAEHIYTSPEIEVKFPLPAVKDIPCIIVGGAVKRPGEFPLRAGMTLMAAISRAGGFDDGANPERVKLIRDNKKQFFDCRTIDPNGSNNPVLNNGDFIMIGKD